MKLYETIDAYRVIPRLLMLVYMVQVILVGEWFMGLETPNNAQSAFVSVVWGAGAAWFMAYVNSGRTEPTGES